MSSPYMHGQELKKAGIPAELMEGLARDPSEEIATLQTPIRTHPNQKISSVEQDQMLREAAATGNISAVEDKYGVSRGYLRSAMTRRFGSLEAMKDVLLGLVTENAIVTQMRVAETVGELTGPQAVFAGKLLVDTMEKVEKSRSNTPKTINFQQLEAVGESLKRLRDVVNSTGTV